LGFPGPKNEDDLPRNRMLTCRDLQRKEGNLKFLLIALAPLIITAHSSLDSTPRAPQQEREVWNAPGGDWWQGPVRYSLGMKEITQYRALETAVARASFIARFWAARDPDLSTPWNEAEEIFWQRVADADSQFRGAFEPGWKSDRGWIYITLGPPDEVIRSHGPAVISWIYRALPDPRAPANLCYAFVREDTTGDYRLATPSQQATMQLCGQRMMGTGNTFSTDFYTPRLQGGKNLPSSRQGPPRGTFTSSDKPAFFPNMDAAAVLVQAIPPILPKTKVTSQEVYGQLFLRHRPSFLPGRGGWTRIRISVGFPRDLLLKGGFPQVSLALTGRLVRAGAEEASYSFGSQSAEDSADARQRLSDEIYQVFQISSLVPPGEYRLTVEGHLGQLAGKTESPILVPDLSGRTLSVVGPILAGRVDAIAEGSSPTDFDIGGLRVYPRLLASYTPGDTFTFYFQTQGAAQDHGRFHLTFRYEVLRREGKLYRSAGKLVSVADNGSPNHAFSLPLRDWLDGDYLLVVTVEDGVGGRTAAASAAFSVQ
jgi:GWxTD domain-containing protein